MFLGNRYVVDQALSAYISPPIRDYYNLFRAVFQYCGHLLLRFCIHCIKERAGEFVSGGRRIRGSQALEEPYEGWVFNKVK